MEKRRHPRIHIKNLSVDASDGVGFFQGVLSDASRFGICVTELPKKLNGKVEKISVIISGQGKNFKISVRPRWSTLDRLSKSLGAEIINPPLGWAEFIMHYEPKAKPNDDVWASVEL